MVEMFVPEILTRSRVDPVVDSVVEALRPIPLTRPVMTAPRAELPPRVGAVGLSDEDDSPQAPQAIRQRMAGSSLTLG
jgi:hypothetical protein